MKKKKKETTQRRFLVRTACPFGLQSFVQSQVLTTPPNSSSS